MWGDLKMCHSRFAALHLSSNGIEFVIQFLRAPLRKLAAQKESAVGAIESGASHRLTSEKCKITAGTHGFAPTLPDTVSGELGQTPIGRGRVVSWNARTADRSDLNPR